MQLKTEQFSRQVSGMQPTFKVTVLAPQNEPNFDDFLTRTNRADYVEPFSRRLC